MFKVKRIELFITNKCSNNCIFCSEIKRFDNTELAFESIKNILLAEKQKGARLVHFMGGEPTLHNHFIDILRLSKALNYRTHLISNGIRFADPLFCKTAFLYLDELGFSIQGHNKKIHDLHTHNNGSFRQLGKAFKNAREYYQGRFLVNVTITRYNAKFLTHIFKLVSQYKPSSVRFLNLVPHGNALGNYRKLSIPFSELKGSIRKLISISGKSGIELRFGGIPLCVLGKENYLYSYEAYEPEMRTGNTFKKKKEMCLWNKEISTEKRHSNPARQIIDMGRIKIYTCKKCVLLAVCGGVFEKYLEIYGTKEIIPQ